MGDKLPAPATAPDSNSNAMTSSDLEAHSPTEAQKASVPPSTKSSLTDEIDLSYAYVSLLLYCLVSGLSDSVAFNAAGVFVSMQTGNTIFLALGASHLPAGQPRLWLKALVSIACFQLGALAFSQFRRLGSQQRKIILFVTCLLQAVFVILAAALAQASVIPAFADSRLSTVAESALREAQANDYVILCPVALLAFQFGGQIYTSRVLGYGEVPTNVLTSLYCDLFSDPKLFVSVRTNAKRNRRIAAAVLTLVGGIAGGWLQRSSAGMPGALWIAAALKVAIAVAWLIWPAKKADTT
ncbi:uncharacterized protein SPSK_02686 [Sporothrix schenckii 1099-18]|uniref:DUF1275 domain protein n=1 Tax=Sporothrix schenckii 1099-18 TaxID=1397361 RepID=A0A0F2MAJ0_SPOSC|nr:uncharacterized protein SPSK_02686 [Sporothrix schenckii 1099-18]KJR86094.1 hypothetical protein SPSK_02686 [Sporothrix schenckii 1099-18]